MELSQLLRDSDACCGDVPRRRVGGRQDSSAADTRWRQRFRDRREQRSAGRRLGREQGRGFFVRACRRSISSARRSGDRTRPGTRVAAAARRQHQRRDRHQRQGPGDRNLGRVRHRRRRRWLAVHAVLWEKGKPIHLGNLGGIAWNTAMAFNEHGDIVGFSNVSKATAHVQRSGIPVDSRARYPGSRHVAR